LAHTLHARANTRTNSDLQAPGLIVKEEHVPNHSGRHVFRDLVIFLVIFFSSDFFSDFLAPGLIVKEEHVPNHSGRHVFRDLVIFLVILFFA